MISLSKFIPEIKIVPNQKFRLDIGSIIEESEINKHGWQMGYKIIRDNGDEWLCDYRYAPKKRWFYCTDLNKQEVLDKLKNGKFRLVK